MTAETTPPATYSDLRALFVNCTLKRSPERSHAGARGRIGRDHDFTNRNATFMSLVHVARLLKDAGGFPAHGNQRALWDAGCRFDFENPEHR